MTLDEVNHYNKEDDSRKALIEVHGTRFNLYIYFLKIKKLIIALKLNKN